MSSYRKQPQRRLTWAEWKTIDPFDQTKYTTFYLSVYEPTWERPYASILLRMSNGSGSAFCRFATIEALNQVFVMPCSFQERVETAMRKANLIADDISNDMRLAMNRRQLAQGGQIIRTDTGEILAEAERIING